MARASRQSVFGRFLSLVGKHGLLPSGSRVLVAVSGGVDSVCLLDLVLAACGRLKLTVSGFHLDHGLRPESRDDARFVLRLFKDRGIDGHACRSDVRGYARRHRVGIEEAARELRFRQMRRAARRLGCDRVALGHNADDNLETVVLNLCRGAGLRGLAGIPVRRGRFVRPLLDVERAELVDYALSRGLAWVEDATNRDPAFRRNLVRGRVVPVLRELNPAVLRNARRASELLASEDRYLDARAARALDRCAHSRRSRVLIDLNGWDSYSVVLRRRMMKLIIPGLDAETVERGLALMAGRRGRLHFPGGGPELRVGRQQAELLLPRTRR